jgi:hypothetical protein
MSASGTVRVGESKADLPHNAADTVLSTTSVGSTILGTDMDINSSYYHRHLEQQTWPIFQPNVPRTIEYQCFHGFRHTELVIDAFLLAVREGTIRTTIEQRMASLKAQF